MLKASTIFFYRINRLLSFIKKRKQIEIIKIENSFHYCGFYYGNQNVFNPYQDYILHFKDNLQLCRNNFIQFLEGYRPSDLNEAFGLDLEKKYSLWTFPWSDYQNIPNKGWIKDPSEIIDIVTHFSPNGILSFKIEQEFYWLERAYATIVNNGYDPTKFSYVQVVRFLNHIGECRYLIAEGNHRIASLYARNVHELAVEVIEEINVKNIDSWIGVKTGLFSKSDALKIFNFYFDKHKTVKIDFGKTTILYQYRI